MYKGNRNYIVTESQMNQLSYFVKPADSVENDIAHLGKQLEVAQALHDNPVIVQYLQEQIDQITSNLMNSMSVSSTPEAAKSHLIQCQSQIRAYDHLYGLYANIVDLRNAFTVLTTEGNTQ